MSTFSSNEKIYHCASRDRDSSDRLDLTNGRAVVIRDTILCCHPSGRKIMSFSVPFPRWSLIFLSSILNVIDKHVCSNVMKNFASLCS